MENFGIQTYLHLRFQRPKSKFLIYYDLHNFDSQNNNIETFLYPGRKVRFGSS